MVGEVGLEPTKAKPADLQSAPFAARDIPPFAKLMKFQAKLQAFHLWAEHPRAGVMVTPPTSVNRKRPPGVPPKKASDDHSLRQGAHRRAHARRNRARDDRECRKAQHARQPPDDR